MLITTEQLVRFLGAAFLITISPGPDVLATVSLGLSRGWRAAVGFGVGCGSGCLLHTLLAVLGVSALLRASPVAFGALRLCGAGYLLWIGWGALRSRG
ncbi:MAG: LysE family translocator, partial [Planctomyces sp.]